MGTRIIIWNARGGCLAEEDKKQMLIEQIKESKQKHGYPIIMLQEAGVVQRFGKNVKEFDTTLYAPYYGYQQMPKKAENKRCTLQTLIPEELIDNIEVYPLDYGFADRPFLVVNFGNFCLANIHAPSGVPPYATACIKKGIALLNLYNLPWLIGGDMNVEKECMEQDYQISTQYQIFAPSQPTHHCHREVYEGNILDYFIGHSSINVENIYVEEVSDDYSDHNMVILDLE